MGYRKFQDLQDLDSNNGFARWDRYVSPNGRRSDAAHAYIHPKLGEPQYANLHVLVETKIVRVLLDHNKRATGVEFTPNPAFQPAAPGAEALKRVVRARKLVVVSCGACGTPGVLERSGIGNPKVLAKAGVPLAVDLPGVGHDYQDHHLAAYPYRTSLADVQTINQFISMSENAETSIQTKAAILGWNSIDIAAKLRPTADEVAALGPEFQAAWDRDFKHAPNRPLMIFAPLSV